METLTPSSSDEMGSLCLSVLLEQDGKRVTLTVVHTLSGSAAFVSLSSRMTLTCARAPHRTLWVLALREGAAASRDGLAATAVWPCETCVSLAKADLRRSLRACSSVG